MSRLQPLLLPTILALGLSFVLDASAASGRGSTTSSPSGRSAGQSSSKSDSGSKTEKSGPTKAGSGFTRSAALRGARADGTRRSLLDGSGSPPSQKVTEIIRERERSGPGWLGTAFLISVLSRHDLSAADRSWIQSRIDEIGPDDNGPAEQPLGAVSPAVSFEYLGIPDVVRAGEQVSLAVRVAGKSSASASSPAQPLRAQCTLDGAKIAQRGSGATIDWTPDSPGVYVLSCEAGGHTSRRLLRVQA